MIEEKRKRKYSRIKVYRLENPHKVNEWKRAYRIRNREKVNAASRKWKLLNRNKVLASKKAYRIKHRKELSDKAGEFYRKNKEHGLAVRRDYRRKNFEKVKDKNTLWRKRNPEKARNLYRRRRIRLKGAFVSCKHVDKSILNWKKSPWFICSYCFGKFDTKDLHIDHIVPTSKSGKHSFDNVAESCQSCNSKKSNKPLLLFLLKHWDKTR